jgi:hypothetical protein
MDYLEKNTIADLVKALELKRKSLAKQRKPRRVLAARR